MATSSSSGRERGPFDLVIAACRIRIRVERFFKSIYGGTQEAVRKNLVEVTWLPNRHGEKIRFNRINGAADALFRVSSGLDEQLSNHLLKYVIPLSGTFNWRKIAGTDRLSAHAFGIAVDINAKQGDYWRWGASLSRPIYKNKIPWQIVEVFEANGFIWGGKWYHFDTMHFEYRPELLASPCVS